MSHNHVSLRIPEQAALKAHKNVILKCISRHEGWNDAVFCCFLNGFVIEFCGRETQVERENPLELVLFVIVQCVEWLPAVPRYSELLIFFHSFIYDIRFFST